MSMLPVYRRQHSALLLLSFFPSTIISQKIMSLPTQVATPAASTPAATTASTSQQQQPTRATTAAAATSTSNVSSANAAASNTTTNTSPPKDQLPRDARLIGLLLASLGATDADPAVVAMLLEFAHRASQQKAMQSLEQALLTAAQYRTYTPFRLHARNPAIITCIC